MRRVVTLVALVLAAALPARADVADQLSPVQKRTIYAYFAQAFVDANSARWRFDKVGPDPRGTLVCGRVNYANSAKVYVGEHRFYIILKKHVTEASENEGKVGFYRTPSVDSGDIYDSVADDPAGGLKRRIEALCGPG